MKKGRAGTMTFVDDLEEAEKLAMPVFFAEITRNRIRRGVFNSVDELKQAIIDYLNHYNGNPKPYVWTKTAAEIFSKVARANQALESQH